MAVQGEDTQIRQIPTTRLLAARLLTNTSLKLVQSEPFLDVGHVNVAGSHAIQGPLIRLLDRTLGADDLVAVMTPDMSPNQLAFGRKTEILARGLNENWPWGQRHSILPMDKTEKDYEDCPHRPFMLGATLAA